MIPSWVSGAVAALSLSLLATEVIAQTAPPLVMGTTVLIQPSGTPASNSICVGGTQYTTSQDDEFFTDSSLNSTSSPPASSGQQWSTEFADGARTNNAGVDSAYYTDASLSSTGNYNPFSLSSQGLTITASPVPSPMASAVGGSQWLSGMLTSPALQYGYIEVSAKVPNNVSGVWPAPLWLLSGINNSPTNQFPNDREDDAWESFGKLLGAGSGIGQQTAIFNYGTTPLPTAFHVNPLVSPDPSTTFHTYGILWTSTYTEFLIDRVPTMIRPTTSVGPMNAEIILQLYNQDQAPTFGAPDLTKLHTETINYYRWYQATASTCSNSAIAVEPTPNPSPSPASTSVSLVQVAPVTQSSTYENVPVSFSRATTPGDMLIAFIAGNNAISGNGGYPTGWQASSNPNIAWCIVGSANGQCPAVPAGQAYTFGGNGAITTAIELSGANNTLGPIVSTGSPPTPILTSGGLNFDYLAAQSATNTVSSITSAQYYNQTTTTLANDENASISGMNQNLYLDEYTTEAAQGGYPLIPAISINPTTSFFDTVQSFISILPAGATPAPSPIPSLPPQPSASPVS